MKRFRAPVLVALLFAAVTVPAVAGGNANFLLGKRDAGGEDFWGSDNEQQVVGVIVDFGKKGWPIHLCLADIDSGHDSNGGTKSISERAFGVMKVWEPQSAIRPYVGAGVATVRVAFEIDTGSGDLVQHDSTSAFYLDGGVFWRTGRRFNIGLGIRVMTQADVEIQGVSGDANYTQFHVLAGWGWPRREKRSASPLPEGTP